jgi:hypothetical protein
MRSAEREMRRIYGKSLSCPLLVTLSSKNDTSFVNVEELSTAEIMHSHHYSQSPDVRGLT